MSGNPKKMAKTFKYHDIKRYIMNQRISGLDERAIPTLAETVCNPDKPFLKYNPKTWRYLIWLEETGYVQFTEKGGDWVVNPGSHITLMIKRKDQTKGMKMRTDR